MPAGSVSFRLADGAIVAVPPETMSAVYEALWELAADREPGATTTAALVKLAERSLGPRPVELDARESVAFRRALARAAAA